MMALTVEKFRRPTEEDQTNMERGRLDKEKMEDLYFDEIGKLVEEHPIVNPTTVRGKAS
ncbi:MAG: hypothetical protein ABL899_00420 [Nitrospira sp.]